MNRLPLNDRTLIVRCLVEGMSIRATARTADVSKNTVIKLLNDAGRACAAYQDKVIRELPCGRVQADEIWSFVHAKEKNVPPKKSAPPEAGDVWTWVAMCADTKLVPTWRIGDRSGMTAIDLMDDLRARLAHRAQLTTDGHSAYFEAIEGAFGGDVDYAQLIKLCGGTAGAEKSHERKYSPAECFGTQTKVVEGNPDGRHFSTSYVERQNMTMRMSMRHFTRLTNGFSKKLENLGHAVALHFMHYNFCRIHKTLDVTPAMAAGVTDRHWDVSDIVKLVEDAAPKPNRPKTYRKRKISN